LEEVSLHLNAFCVGHEAGKQEIFPDYFTGRVVYAAHRRGAAQR